MTTAIFCPDGHACKVELDQADFEIYGYHKKLDGYTCRFNNFRIRAGSAPVSQADAAPSSASPSEKVRP